MICPSTAPTTAPIASQERLDTGAPRVRFYAGHPICSSDGWRIGTLCLIDDHPRTFTATDERDLRLRAARERHALGRELPDEKPGMLRAYGVLLAHALRLTVR